MSYLENIFANICVIRFQNEKKGRELTGLQDNRQDTCTNINLNINKFK